jgi:hypothetical protein
VKSGKEGLCFIFNSKLLMLRFFASEDGKTVNDLKIDATHIKEPIQIEVEETSSNNGAKSVKRLETIEERDEVEETTSNNGAESVKRLEAIKARDKIINEKENVIEMLRKEVAVLRRRREQAAAGQPSLTLCQLLSMEFLAEGHDGQVDRTAFPRALLGLLASPRVRAVELVEGEPVLRFKDRASLHTVLRKLKPRSRESVEAMAGEQRAAIGPDPATGEYGLAVELQEAGLLRASIPAVEAALLQAGGRVTLQPRGFRVWFPDLAGLLRALRAGAALRHHTVSISRRNLHFYSGGRANYDGFPCLTERELLGLAGLAAERDGGDMSGGLSRVLGHLAIQDVTEDWAGELVAVLDTVPGLRKLLAHWATSRAALTLASPCRLAACRGLYSLEWAGGRLDPLHFQRYGELSAEAAPGRAATRSKAFIGRALLDTRLMATYPGLAVAAENIVRI